MAAHFGCIKYVQYFTTHECDYVSPYYKGLIFQHAIEDLTSLFPLTKIQLACWLVEQGANLRTKQWGHEIEAPLETLLSETCNVYSHRAPMQADVAAQPAQVAQLLVKLFSGALNSTGSCLRWIGSVPSMLGETTLPEAWVEIGVDRLYRLVMYVLARQGAKVEDNR